MSYIADTDIIDKLVEGEMSLDDLPSDQQLVAVRAQMYRLGTTVGDVHRENLLLKFEQLSGYMEPTAMLVQGDRVWQQLHLRNGVLRQKLRRHLEEHSETKINAYDILLADVALSNDLTLLTTNSYLAEVVRTLGGEALHLGGFL